MSRVKWSKKEDEMCLRAVNKILKQEYLVSEEQYKFTQKLPVRFKWKQVSNLVKTRTSKQCRERYFNQISPYINNSKWSEEEDKRLETLYEQYSSKWNTIEAYFDRRPSNMIKMRWRVLKRRKKRQQNIEQPIQTLINDYSNVHTINQEVSIIQLDSFAIACGNILKPPTQLKKLDSFLDISCLEPIFEMNVNKQSSFQFNTEEIENMLNF